MKDGRCPKCDSSEVFKKINGVISDSKQIYVRGISTFTPGTDRLSYVCSECGYYENYITDRDILRKIPGKWDKACSID